VTLKLQNHVTSRISEGHPYTKFEHFVISRFWVLLRTNRQTNKQTVPNGVGNKPVLVLNLHTATELRLREKKNQRPWQCTAVDELACWIVSTSISGTSHTSHRERDTHAQRLVCVCLYLHTHVRGRCKRSSRARPLSDSSSSWCCAGFGCCWRRRHISRRLVYLCICWTARQAIMSCTVISLFTGT